MNGATLVATLTTKPSPEGKEIIALPKEVKWLEVRADLTGDLDIAWLRNRFQGRLLYALRSRHEGGHFEGTRQQRLQRLYRAAQDYDLIELEGARDIFPELLNTLPPEKRLISWYGSAKDFQQLHTQFEQLSCVDARFYKLVPTAVRADDGLAPLLLLKILGRRDVIAFADGLRGFWTRLLMPHIGAPMIFGTVTEELNNLNTVSISRLIEDYGLPALSPVKELFGIVGNSIYYSLSPRLHNAAYRTLDKPALYIPFHTDSFTDFYDKIIQNKALEQLGFSLRGLTITSPHKELAIENVTRISPMVQKVNATNLIIQTENGWMAHTTDHEGIMEPLRQQNIQLKSKRVAVIGCGGAGRAVAAALKEAGAQVTLVNRGWKRGENAARLLKLPFVPLSEFSVQDFSLIVNAILGSRDNNKQLFKLNGLKEDAVVSDFIYGITSSPLISNAKARGLMTIDGYVVLRAQVERQFFMMTGQEMPKTVTDDFFKAKKETI